MRFVSEIDGGVVQAYMQYSVRGKVVDGEVVEGYGDVVKHRTVRCGTDDFGAEEARDLDMIVASR